MKPESRWIVRLAHAGFVLVLMIVATSAFIRLSAGLPDASSATIEAARIAHRVSASIAGLLVLAVAGMVLTRERRHWPDVVLATSALVVTSLLAWIGRYSGPDASAAVLVSNLVGGLALSSLLWAIAARQAAVDTRPTHSRDARLAFAALGVVTLQCATGAMTVTEFAKMGPMHHWSAILAFALCAWLGMRLARTSVLRFTGCAILALALLQVVLGIAALGFSLPLWLVLAHNVGAALLLAALVQICIVAASSRTDSAASTSGQGETSTGAEKAHATSRLHRARS